MQKHRIPNKAEGLVRVGHIINPPAFFCYFS